MIPGSAYLAYSIKTERANGRTWAQPTDFRLDSVTYSYQTKPEALEEIA